MSSTEITMPRAQAALTALRRRIEPNGLTVSVDRLLERVEYRIATSGSDIEEVRRHRHEAYVAAGHYAPRPDRRLADGLDNAPASRLYVARLGQQLVGSVRISLATERRPEGYACELFPDAVGPLLANGGIVVDPSRLTVDAEAGRRHPLLHFAVLRLPIMASVHYGAEHCLTMVQPRHAAFYRRTMRATHLCDARPFPGATREVALMAVHVPSAIARGRSRFGFWLPRPGETEALMPPLEELLPGRQAE